MCEGFVVDQLLCFLIVDIQALGMSADQPQRGPVREQYLIVAIIMRIEMHQ